MVKRNACMQLGACLVCGETPTIFRQVGGFSQCPACSALIRTPFPSDEELAALYERSWRDPDQHVPETGGTGVAMARLYSDALARSLGRQNLSGLRILDFGAGRGEMLAALEDRGADVFGIDPFSWRFILAAGFHAYPTLLDLPSDLRLDGVVMIDVIEHVPAPAAILQRLGAILKPEGWLFVATANAAGAGARVSGTRYREARKPGHVALFSSEALETLLRRCGYRRYRRLKWFVRYTPNPLRRCFHYFLQFAGLDGELRYLAWTQPRSSTPPGSGDHEPAGSVHEHQ